LASRVSTIHEDGVQKAQVQAENNEEHEEHFIVPNSMLILSPRTMRHEQQERADETQTQQVPSAEDQTQQVPSAEDELDRSHSRSHYLEPKL
jgi:hypothetical protein